MERGELKVLCAMFRAIIKWIQMKWTMNMSLLLQKEKDF
jgi:hypothetical protein